MSNAADGVFPLNSELERQADGFVAELIAHDPLSPEFGAAAARLGLIGKRAEATLAALSAADLDRPLLSAGQDALARGEAGLHRVLDDLDPACLAPPRGLARLWTRTSPADYFVRAEAARGRIEAALGDLLRGIDNVCRDSVALTGRMQAWEAAEQALDAAAALAGALDVRLEAVAARLGGSDPARARALQGDALAPLRQRAADLSVQRALARQARGAFAIIGANNDAVVASARQVRAVLLVALQTAETAAQVLTGQDLDLARSVAPGAGELPPGPAAAAGGGAAGAVMALQRAFGDVRARIEAVRRARSGPDGEAGR